MFGTIRSAANNHHIANLARRTACNQRGYVVVVTKRGCNPEVSEFYAARYVIRYRREFMLMQEFGAIVSLLFSIRISTPKYMRASHQIPVFKNA